MAVATFRYFEYGILNGISRQLIPSAMKHRADGSSHLEDRAAMPSEWEPEAPEDAHNATASLQWKKRDILVIDEAHNLPDFLVSFFTMTASSKWPRFDFLEFRNMVDEAEESNPGDVSNATFAVFRDAFNGYYEQEERLEGGKGIGAGTFPTVRIRERVWDVIHWQDIRSMMMRVNRAAKNEFSTHLERVLIEAMSRNSGLNLRYPSLTYGKTGVS